MNETQWMYEHEVLSIEEEHKYEDMALVANAAKKAVINMLGLNLVPIKDEDTGLLRMREDHEIVPLMMFICREDMAMEIKEKYEDMEAQELALAQVEDELKNDSEVTADSFDDFMDSDLEFIDDNEAARLAVINSPEHKFISDKVVNKIEGENENKFNEILGLDDKISYNLMKDIPFGNKSVEIEKDTSFDNKSVEIESEDVLIGKAPRRKMEITIEPEDE